MSDATPTNDPSKHYDFKQVEQRIYQRWLDGKAFQAIPDAREETFVVMMPLPNVTGALHMGHAMDNVMQDLLTRWHRMRGFNTLWMPGTDHAGIATQAVVERRLRELEGKTRHDIGRDALVQRIWDWKDQYQKRIVAQQREMGCSCDWDRQRFTMDPVCARAVRHTFFSMFRDGLLYRGYRLVNWDCHLQTAVADDEIVHEKVAGHFWHLRYPIIDPRPGEPEFVVVATTRPETMLGDTAVACHPEPARELARRLEELRARVAAARAKDREALLAELAALEERERTQLPLLETLARMAADGRKVRLPLLDREIPLIADVWAKPELGSGCVKITPAHDPNDYEVWTRHSERIERINLLEPDGTLNANAGPYAGLDRFEARARVVADLDAQGRLERVEDREVEIGHSDRSKTPVEPYLSKQWFVRMGDRPEGVICGRGTPNEFRSRGLAQAAIDAVEGEWRSASGRKLEFHPDPVRYGNTYLNWLSEKRDWCVSRQLWWGHQIPVWRRELGGGEIAGLRAALEPWLGRADVVVRSVSELGEERLLEAVADLDALADEPVLDLQICPLDLPIDDELGPKLDGLGFERDPDVLDTWFSSGLWPHSTLGWPDPETAEIDPGQLPLCAGPGRPSALDYYYPGSCLVTGRDIITLWVARMVLMGLYNLGDLPFSDCFIHATILDGKGERMSKSKGNGIDPVDIIDRYGADAMRYVICEMQTGMQDVRLPVQAISPYTGDVLELAELKHGDSIFTYMCPHSQKEFDVLGMSSELPSATLISDRFNVGGVFCTKLWNAARFVFLNLGEAVEFRALTPAELRPEDRWILSRLARARDEVHAYLEAYNPSSALLTARNFFWGEVCDWYLEWIKPRLRDERETPVARQVLALLLDHVLRLLHPFVPFISEELWSELGRRAPLRGIATELALPELLVHARWPDGLASWSDAALEERFELVQELVRGVRSVRSKYEVPPRERIQATLRARAEVVAPLLGLEDLLQELAGLSELTLSETAEPSASAATAVVGEIEIYLEGVIDLDKERERLSKQRQKLEKLIASVSQKLGNEKFVGRAPAQVVETERRRLADAEAELDKVRSGLERIG